MIPVNRKADILAISSAAQSQGELFAVAGQQDPPGYRYMAELISAQEEADLLEAISCLPLEPYMFRGFPAARRVVSFGGYGHANESGSLSGEIIPAFLLPLRARVAAFAGLAAKDFSQALVTEYAPGAGIGWHRDRPVFGDIAGVSLAAPCTLRFRLKEGPTWRRICRKIAPRSAYLLHGPARDLWQHSIAPLGTLRYSVTFRTARRRD